MIYGELTYYVGFALLRCVRPPPFWKHKVKDLFPLLSYADGVQMAELAVPKAVCRSAHTASVLTSADEQDELLLLFGGASHLFIFLSTFDVFNLTIGALVGKRLEPLVSLLFPTHVAIVMFGLDWVRLLCLLLCLFC